MSSYFKQSSRLQVSVKLTLVCFTLLFFNSSEYLWSQRTGQGYYTPDLDSLSSKNSYIQKMSMDGAWMTIKTMYSTKADTYLLVNTETAQAVDIEQCFKHDFSKTSHWLGYLTPSHTFTLQSLRDSRVFTYSGVIDFEFDSEGRYLSLLKNVEGNTKTLWLIDLESFHIEKVEGVQHFAWHPERRTIAINTLLNEQSEISLYNLGKEERRVLIASDGSNFNQLQWNTQGTTLFFMEEQEQSSILHLVNCTGLHYTMDASTFKDIFPDYLISNQEITLSDDGQLVYFYRMKDEVVDGEDEHLEVWDTMDPWIFPRMAYYNAHENRYFLTLWDVKTNTLQTVTDLDFPSVHYHPNHRYAIVFNTLQYEPQYKQFEDVDLYVKDLYTGRMDLIVEKHYNRQGSVSISSKGDYVAFFKNHHWWLYNIKTKETRNLTEDSPVSFEDCDVHGAQDSAPYGRIGWSDDDSHLILHDEYDVWLVDVESGNKQRITNGRENEIRYRISNDVKRHDKDYINSVVRNAGVSHTLKDGLIFKMTGADLRTGYAMWNQNTPNLDIVFYGDLLTDDLLILNYGTKLVYKKSKYNHPPGIYLYQLNTRKETLLHQSNPNLLNYDLGKETLFEYQVEKDTLKGLLFYPSHFNPDKDYPLIVQVYETYSTDDLSFKPPSLYEETGFNILNYTTQDYFVLIPTISYSIEHPGFSALKSVTAAVTKAIEDYAIDKERVGIIGHSFGGYEVNFIATQCNLFQAAVSGAAVSDLVSWYHDIGWDWKKDQIWRIESQQFRMGKPYYQLKESYRNNSPINSVEDMNTPLLLWNGQKDTNTNWVQGINMYMAMKRLKKPGKLLLFKDEGHVIIQPKNQYRLSLDIKAWFDAYLKKE